MVRKIIKYLLWAVVAVVLLVVGCVAALYTPAVQRVAVRGVARLLSAKSEMDIGIGELRLRFPLRMSAADILVRHSSGYDDGRRRDTLLYCRRAATDIALVPLIRGCIVARNTAIDTIRLCCRDSALDIAADLGRLRLDRVGVSVTQRGIVAQALELGHGACRYEGHKALSETTADTLKSPWTISVQEIRAVDLALAYEPRLAVENLSLAVDSLDIRGRALSLRLNSLSFDDRSGVRVRDGRGRVNMDADTLLVSDLRLATLRSTLAADLHASGSVLTLDPQASIRASVRAVLGFADLDLLLPDRVPEALKRAFAKVDFSVGGQLECLAPVLLRADLEPLLSLKASAAVERLTKTDGVAARGRADLHVPNPDTLVALFAANLRERISVTQPLDLALDADFARHRVAGNLSLEYGGGRVVARGALEPHGQRYALSLRADSLPLEEILPHDSISVSSLQAVLSGEGLSLKQTTAQGNLAIDRAAVRGFAFSGADLDARVSSGNLAARLDLDSVAFVAADSLPLRYLSAVVATDSTRFVAALHSEDLDLGIHGDEPLGRFVGDVGRFGDTLVSQRRRLDADALAESLPPFSLRASLRGNGLARTLLQPHDISFSDLELRADNGRESPLNAVLSVEGLARDSVTLDSLHLGLRQRSRYLDFDLRAAADSAAVALDGYASAEELHIALSPLDLSYLVAFFDLPDLQLSGTLSGRLHARGDLHAPSVDAALSFDSTRVYIPMSGARLLLPRDTVRVSQSRLHFDGYTLQTSGGGSLVFNGALPLTAAADSAERLVVRGRNMLVVDLPRSALSPLYGRGYTDLDATVEGSVSAPVVRGNVRITGNTAVGYTLPSSDRLDSDKKSSVVSFVDFSAAKIAPEKLEQRRKDADDAPPRGIDLAAALDIDPNVSLAVNLSSDGANRADLRGGGALAVTLNPEGDMDFSGRYTISSGTLRYNPPIISAKIFRVSPDSYVEWTGDVADPAFHISATEQVRVSVTMDGESPRTADFDVIVTLRNSLEDLELGFDLAVSDDLALQNQIASLTAEQRAQQAMNLLLYNTYSGPGVATRSVTGNPLNTFLQGELNRWAQSTMPGVDLTFGVESYDTENAAQRTDYSYRLSKSLFGNRVRAVIGGRIASDADPTENLRDNLIDDLSLEYLLSRDGNIYIRLFRHADNSDILEGEIIETGVGFVVHKRLSRLGDLFRSKKRIAELENQNRIGDAQ